MAPEAFNLLHMLLPSFERQPLVFSLLLAGQIIDDGQDVNLVAAEREGVCRDGHRPFHAVFCGDLPLLAPQVVTGPQAGDDGHGLILDAGGPSGDVRRRLISSIRYPVISVNPLVPDIEPDVGGYRSIS